MWWRHTSFTPPNMAATSGVTGEPTLNTSSCNVVASPIKTLLDSAATKT